MAQRSGPSVRGHSRLRLFSNSATHEKHEQHSSDDGCDDKQRDRRFPHPYAMPIRERDIGIHPGTTDRDTQSDWSSIAAPTAARCTAAMPFFASAFVLYDSPLATISPLRDLSRNRNSPLPSL